MIIVGDIGNTETKICLINSNKKIIKKINLNTKKITKSLIKKSFSYLRLKDKKIKKCLFCSVVPKSFNLIKKSLIKDYKINCYELKNLNLHKLINIRYLCCFINQGVKRNSHSWSNNTAMISIFN